MWPLMHHISCSLLVKHQITQVTQPPYSLDMVPCDFWLFPKLKSRLKGKRFQIINEIQWDGNWENCVRPPCTYFERDWSIIILCTMFIVSSSRNVSIFHITWLDTFRTDLVCHPLLKYRNIFASNHFASYPKPQLILQFCIHTIFNNIITPFIYFYSIFMIWFI